MAVFLDNLYVWGQIAVVLCGLVVFITGKLISDRETEKSDRLSKEVITLNTKLEEQREKTARAEAELLSLHTFIKQPRQVDSEALTAILKDAPKGMIEPLLYFENSADALLVALSLGAAFKANGWVVAEPQPISATGNPIKSRPLGPPIGISIETGCTRSPEGRWEEPANSVWRAVIASNAESTAVAMSENRDLPKDKCTIVIGLKSW